MQKKENQGKPRKKKKNLKLNFILSESAIRSLFPLMKIPGMVSLAGGVPNPLTFPFESCSFKLRDGTSIELQTKKLNEALQYTQTV